MSFTTTHTVHIKCRPCFWFYYLYHCLYAPPATILSADIIDMSNSFTINYVFYKMYTILSCYLNLNDDITIAVIFYNVINIVQCSTIVLMFKIFVKYTILMAVFQLSYIRRNNVVSCLRSLVTEHRYMYEVTGHYMQTNGYDYINGDELLLL